MTLVKFKKTAPTDFMNSFFNEVWNNNHAHFPRQFAHATTAVNVSENETNFVLEFSVPGFTKENLKVKLEGDTLTVSGEIKNDTENTERTYKRREFNNNSFSRAFTLPDNIDGENIGGKYENGILTVTLPKKAAEKQSNVREINLN